MTRRKWCTHDFLAESQKLLERASISKDADLTPPAEGLSNISKYPGHLPDFTCYDGNPRNQGLVGVDGACVNKTSYGPRGRSLGRRSQASVVSNLPDPPNPSPWICCVQCTWHICAEMCRRSVMLEPHTSLYVGWNTLQ
ncbi:uncharacterized protein TNCV_2046021 [Trichonephila clavipes]|uniref:Uncharacterized protein n=1 Tax=Trichonephila clavipes TaxID=2585209 RepID=A0A8X6STY6_TRICX|nr:uncharacterized protein TNCV_2046021 [Trichonephila clavipes]